MHGRGRDCSGGGATKLYRSAVVWGSGRWATMKTPSVLAGSAPAPVTVPLLLAALDAATPAGDLRDLVRQMREAVVEAKVAVRELGEGVVRTEAELAAERQRLADAERRGRLAAEIQDRETVDVAARFAAKHRERLGVLERKLAAQRDELGLTQRELTEMQAQLARAERDRPLTEAERSAERAWRDLEAGGGVRPGTDLRDELLKSQLDRTAREAAADQQLRELKKKMKKD